MGYLVCQNCGGYYKLKKDESAEDFVACQCYGQLVYVESLEYLRKEDAKDKHSKTLYCPSKNNVLNGSECIVVDEDFKPEPQSETKTGENIEIKKDSDQEMKEPGIKNRAYYRRYDYYSEPDINYLKNLKDVTGLINALYYDDVNIQLEALQALAAVGDDRALNHLNKLIQKGEGSLKLYAEIAIKQIQSRKHGYKSLNRENFRQIPSESLQSHLPHKTIHDDPLNAVPKEQVNLDDDSLSVVSKDDVRIDDVDPDVLEIHDKTEHTVVDEIDLSQHSPESDVNQAREEIIHQEEIKKSTPAASVTKETFTEKIHEQSTLDEHKTILKDETDSSTPENLSTKSMGSGDIEVSSLVEASRIKKSETQLTDLGSPEPEISPVEHVEYIKISEIENFEDLKPSSPDNSIEKPVKTNKLSEKVSPETELISDSNASFKDLSKGLSDNTIPVTMKTVDDTLLSPESSENKSTANSNGQSMLSSVTRLFKKSSTPVSFSSDSQGLKRPSPVPIPTTVDFKSTDSVNKNEKDDYRVSWFGLNNSDKQIIIFIILFAIILVMGVVLTMTQMKI